MSNAFGTGRRRTFVVELGGGDDVSSSVREGFLGIPME